LGKLLTAQQVVADKLQGHVTDKWLLMEAQAGRVPCLRLGPRKVLFDEDEMDAWIEARRVKAETVAT
jgi:hypothetical protein